MAQHGNILDRTYFNPDDPQIHVVGYGTMSLSFAKKRLAEKFKEIVAAIEDDKMESVYYLLKSNGVLSSLLHAIKEVEADLATPEMKRKATILRAHRRG